MATNNSAVGIPQQMLAVLKSENYDSWSLKMKMFFQSNDLWMLVDTSFNDDEERLTAAQCAELRENRKHDSKALFFIHFIQTAVDEEFFPKIMGAKNQRLPGIFSRRNSRAQTKC